MAALAIIGHSEPLVATLYAAIEEEFPVMDSIDCPFFDSTLHERDEFMDTLIDMLIGNVPTTEEFHAPITAMLDMFDNEMLVYMIQKGQVASLIVKDNGFYLAELRGEHAA